MAEAKRFVGIDVAKAQLDVALGPRRALRGGQRRAWNPRVA